MYRGLCGGGFGIFKMCLREGSCHIIGVNILYDIIYMGLCGGSGVVQVCFPFCRKK